MTVEELIERLRECSLEARVVLCINGIAQDYDAEIIYDNVMEVVDTGDYVILKNFNRD